jgi:hypothetical protein
MENFDSSLSTYYQNNIDKDIINTTNSFNNYIPLNNTRNLNWNGNWTSINNNNNDNIYAQFVQLNDRLLITITNRNIANDNDSASSNFDTKYLYSGVALLNKDKNIFILRNPVNNNCYIGNKPSTGDGLKFGYNLTGYVYFEGKSGGKDIYKIKLFLNNNNNRNILTLEKNSDYNKDNTNLENNQGFTKYDKGKEYINSNNPYLRASDFINKSSFSFDNNFCPLKDGMTQYTPCMYSQEGLGETRTYNGIVVNACGSPVNGNNCTAQNVYCGIGGVAGNKGSGGSGLACTEIINPVYQNINFLPFKILSQINSNNNLDVCNYLSNFDYSKFNQCILCYVSNVGSVYTLNYTYMDTLIMQKDMMNYNLNKDSTIYKNLLDYRKTIDSLPDSFVSPIAPAVSANLTSSEYYNSLTLTNYLENLQYKSDPDMKYNKILEISVPTIKKYVQNYIPDNTVRSNYPTLWNIKLDKYITSTTPPTSGERNIKNSCEFTLNTSELFNIPNLYEKTKEYNTQQVKYLATNNDGSTSLKLYNSGTDKKFILENANILKQNISSTFNPATDYIAISANIRAFNKLYVLPSFDNSNSIKLSPEPEANGKWVIFGISLSTLTLDSSISQLKALIESFQFD